MTELRERLTAVNRTQCGDVLEAVPGRDRKQLHAERDSLTSLVESWRVVVCDVAEPISVLFGGMGWRAAARLIARSAPAAWAS